MSNVGDSLAAALKLHGYLVRAHWRGDGLVGPDPGIRINYRIGRFLKSYTRGLDWKDDLYYLQAQGYWVLGNWELFDHTSDPAYARLATACCERIVQSQCDDGAWVYPNREWKGRVATVEGIWASMALMETYRRTGDDRLIATVRRWHRYLVETIGFQHFGDETAINYFARETGAPVPNNSADALRFLATIAGVTGDEHMLEPCRRLVAFLRRVQQPSGEFPYQASKSRDVPHPRPHFQCYQYNAFMCDGLMRYLEQTADPSVEPMVVRALAFIARGIDATGAVRYQCDVPYRHVTYHAGVVAAVFARAHRLGLHDEDATASRVYHYVLSRQRIDGSFIYSTGDYRFLSDQRSYPRYLAMIMYHLLQRGARERVHTRERHSPRGPDAPCPRPR